MNLDSVNDNEIKVLVGGEVCSVLHVSQYRVGQSYTFIYQELMSAAKRREGASNYRTLFVPSSVESRALNFS